MVKNFLSKIGRIIGILFLCLMIFLAILCGYLAGSMLKVAEAAPKVNPDTLLSGLNENSTIVDSSGNLVEQIETAEYRKIVPYEQIPKNLVNAFISAEDRRFYEHNGVDFIGILATVKDFFSSGNMRGASTITMQLARDMYLNKDVNWIRKIQEIFVALQIDKMMTKDQIMESYLNRIFFGQNAYGVEAASQIYFSKNVQDLNLAQCAALASIVPAPSHYALYVTYRPSQVKDERVLGETSINGERYMAIYNPPAYEREKYVLKEMLKNGYISQAEYDEAVNTDVAATIQPPTKRADNISNYVTQLVRDQAISVLMDSQNITETEARQLLLYGGLTVTTTVDMDLQRKLQDYVGSIQRTVSGTVSGSSGDLAINVSLDSNGNLLNRNGNLIYYKRTNLLDSNNQVVIPKSQYTFDNSNNLIIRPGRVRGYNGYLDITDMYDYDENDVLRVYRVGTIPINADSLSVDGEGMITIAAKFLQESTTPLYTVRDDGALILNSEYYDVDQRGTIQPQIAMTVLDTKTGEVRAVIGGRESDETFYSNRATDFPRQPGSSFKPLADYTGAIALGYNQGAVMDDVPYQMLDGNPWPRNVTGRYQGLMNMYDALIISSNPVAVRWLEKIGMDVSKEYLTRYGIIDRNHPERDHFVEASEDAAHNDENLSMAIGSLTTGVTTLEMANAYQALGNNGTRNQALCISKITDNSGKVYFENKHTAIEVTKPEENYQLLDILKDYVTVGYTKNYISKTNIDVAGKTGTTNDQRDFWFCGTSPYYSVAIWTGPDNGQLSLKGDSGIAARLFAQVNAILNEGKEAAEFEIPAGLHEEEICMLSGMKPTAACKSDPKHGVKTVLVSDATAPKEECNVHVIREIDVRNNLLANDNLPGFLKASRVFIQRPVPYDPSKFNGITPEDWSLQVPTAYSNLPSVLQPSTVTNPDGSTTVRTYDMNDGSFVDVTTYPDQSKKTVYYDAAGNVLREQVTEAPSAPSTDAPNNNTNQPAPAN
ncbi:transglycosylase domain-containing protein [Peptoniphilaceae bacterium SGI.137]|nr:transglycosylase domain-containing protein [Peptoniphilaceae bacterium]MCI6659456.1 transglycosylase domain-containing protein [Peptoniphilaceae bacterium]MDY3986886.1 transglycosylase domain-containing protein [Peptoniphilaceae bacterium]MDY6146171.1 transglycosylase domain-containing protein [Peptoniphilaceae bacterium]